MAHTSFEKEWHGIAIQVFRAVSHNEGPFLWNEGVARSKLFQNSQTKSITYNKV